MWIIHSVKMDSNWISAGKKNKKKSVKNMRDFRPDFMSGSDDCIIGW